MASAAVTERPILRCPVCLAPQTVKHETPSGQRLICPACACTFEKQNGLPLPRESPAPSRPALEARTEPSARARWTGSVAAASGLLALTLWIGSGQKGPEFLKFYFVVGLIGLLGTLLLKAMPSFSSAGIVGFVVYEGLGVSRLITGFQAGMHRFGFLLLMMIIGGILFLLRFSIEYDWISRGGCSSSGWSSGCGSSCGSSCGGGCGGGCGGCGSS